MSDTVLFLVRVWERQREFRAAVRAPGDEAPRLFTNPERLGQFLREAATDMAQRGEGDEDEG